MILEDFGDPPPLPTLDISQEIVGKVAETIRGESILGVIDIYQVQLRLKTYIGYSKELQEEINFFVE